MNKNDLIADNINFLNEYIPKMIIAIEEVVGCIENKRVSEASSILISIIEAFGWTVTSLESLERLGYISGLKINEVTNLLEEIEHALHIKDFVLLSDLLQYELLQRLINWNEKSNILS